MEVCDGRRATLPVPQPPEITIHDIAVSLAKQCRFRGYCHGFYSVAEHSWLVAQYLRATHPDTHRLPLLGLLHDAHEAYTGDIPTPFKRILGLDLIHRIEADIQHNIYQALSLPPPEPSEEHHIHQADRLLLATEAYHLMTSRGADWSEFGVDTDCRSHDILPRCVPWERAFDLFIREYHDLSEEVGQ
jgi:hypothetical protein